MDYTKIQGELISQRAEELQSAATSMQMVLDDVAQLINRIGADGVWSGTAAEETRRKFDSLMSKMPEFYVSTARCYTYLMSIVDRYQTVDRSITNN